MTIWRKSSHSGGTSTQSDCIEVAQLDQTVGLRDSKAPDSGHLTLSPTAFSELLVHLKHTET